MRLLCLLALLVGLCPEVLAWTVTTTGITGCQDADGKAINCPHSGQSCYGQDANFIRPPQTFNLGSLDVVVDPHTGLTWQRNDDGIQRNWQEAVNYCQSLDLDNQQDWRLPSITELETIVSLTCLNTPFIDPDSYFCINLTAFPNTHRDAAYWTATDLHPNNTGAWYVGFGRGSNTGWINKVEGLGYARCVRGATLPQGPFVTTDTTVADQATGLTWEKTLNESALTWASALSYCYNLTKGGYTDWRLPDRRELGSIIDFAADTPALNAVFTVNTPSVYLWSSSPYGIDEYGDAHAFGIDLQYGYTNSISGGGIHPLCVRGGQVSPKEGSVPYELLLLTGN